MNDAATSFAFRDPDLPLEQRVEDLLSRLTLAEKAAQMLHEAPSIPRLGVPAYNWWNECLHGVARAGIATVFPQAIGLAAIWNPRRLFEVASAIADEARAKHHEALRLGDHGYYKGLTFWSPNINIFRDPRWGRGHETYGECPELTAALGSAFCRGLQGDDPRYLKVVATPKHFAVHSGPEAERHSFDAQVSLKDLYETYLPAFHRCVTEARAHSVMAAYNRTNGEPCCASPTLLGAILRRDWGFDGYVVSDCWAIKDFHEHHGVTRSFAESAALAVKAGCDLNCGCSYGHIPEAVALGLLAESDVDTCLRRLLRARFLLGMFDPDQRVPHAAIPYEVNDCERHRALALECARESLVLLVNDGLLPLRRELGSIAVIGPNAADPRALLGNYHGTPSSFVTPLEGIRRAVSPATKVWFSEGCAAGGTVLDAIEPQAFLCEAVSQAMRAEVIVLCLGLNAELEGEQNEGNATLGGDKSSLELPPLQAALLEAVLATGKPTIVVLLSGSPLTLRSAPCPPRALIQAWYPGEEGGQALADLLFGAYSPAARLPVTFPRNLEDLPAFTDYAMRGRTYRYLESPPLYPFGYGLSYTRFEYSELVIDSARVRCGESVNVSVLIENAGKRDGDEVVQLYLKDLEASTVSPHHSLRAFERLHLAVGERRRLTFTLGPRELSLIDEQGRRVLEPGRFRVSVGGSQPDPRSVELMGSAPLALEFAVEGEPLVLPY
jgi:beta-glucosidase